MIHKINHKRYFLIGFTLLIIIEIRSEPNRADNIMKTIVKITLNFLQKSQYIIIKSSIPACIAYIPKLYFDIVRIK